MDGRPVSEMFYDEIWALFKKFADSGLTNAECVGVLELVKADLIKQVIEREILPF